MLFQILEIEFFKLLNAFLTLFLIDLAILIMNFLIGFHTLRVIFLILFQILDTAFFNELNHFLTVFLIDLAIPPMVDFIQFQNFLVGFLILFQTATIKEAIRTIGASATI